MFKIQTLVLALIGIITFGNLMHPGTLTLDPIGRRGQCSNKSGLDLMWIDSTQIIVRVGNIIKDTASTNEIIANRGLRIVLKGYPRDFKMVVLHFYITTINKAGDTIAVNVGTSSNLLSKDQIDVMKRLNGYGKIIFHRIRAVGVSGTVRELHPFSLILRG